MNQYRKAIAAVVAAVLMVGNTYFDLSELVGMQTEIVNLVVAGLAAAGVYQFENVGE